LIFGCIVAMTEGDLLEQLIGAFGLVFFGVALAIMIFALLRSGDRGTFELSKEGIYMSHIGYVLPWSDIGPAWIASAKHQGGTTKDVVFLLRNVSRHTAKMGIVGRLLMNISKKASHSKSGGVLDWGLKTVLLAADADDETEEQLSTELGRMRDSVINDPDSTVFNVPIPLRLGISAEDLVGIVNREVALNNNFLQKNLRANESEASGCT